MRLKDLSICFMSWQPDTELRIFVGFTPVSSFYCKRMSLRTALSLYGNYEVAWFDEKYVFLKEYDC